MSETQLVPAPAPNRLVPAADLGTLKAFLESEGVTKQLAKALPSNLTADRLIRQTVSLVHKTPKLLKCTQISVLLGMMQSAELGLELSGPLGQGYLIPRWNGSKDKKCLEATFQIGWRGLSALAFRSGKVLDMPIRTVYAKDGLDVNMGSTQNLFHNPNLKDRDRGEAVAYYTVVHLANGGMDFEIMTRAECELHRDKYAKRPEFGTWVWDTNFDEMAQKTTTRRLCKRLPMCPEAQAAALEDEYAEAQGAGLMPGAEKPSRTDEVFAQLEGPAEGEPAVENA